jgi:MFS family permease
MTLPPSQFVRRLRISGGLAALLLGRFLAVFAAGLFDIKLLWLAIETADNVETVALVLGLRLLPFIILGVFGGWVGDNLDRRAIIIVAYVVRVAIIAIGMAALFYGASAIAVLGVTGFLLTAIRNITSPTIRAIIPQLCSAPHLHRAVSTFETLDYAATIIAPVVGGFALAAFPPLAVFAIIAILFLGAAIISIALPRRPQTRRAPAPLINDYGSLLVFMLRRRTAFVACIAMNTLAIVAVSGAELLMIPIHTDKMFPDDPALLGTILSVMALSGMLGAMTTGLMRTWPQQATLYAAWVVYGISLASFALLERQSTILFAAAALGYSGAIVDTLLMVMMQRAVSGRHRAKLLGLMSIVFNLGDVTSLWVTALVASTFGYPAVFPLAAAITICIAGSGLWLTRQEVPRAAP